MGKVAVYPRFVERRIRDALTDTRVVLLVGPRQSGKTTLAQKLAGKDMVFLTLDNATTLDSARTDPVGFVRGLDRAVIDEIQRAPDLLLAIKESVDNDPRPGRFLLTGSSNLMTLPRVADSLAGRMETVRLLPLARSEILGNQPSFFRDVFSDRTPAVSEAIVGDDLIELVLAGGYPEGLARRSPLRRERWYLDYVDAILQRDLQDVAQIEQAQQMPRLLRVLAQHAGQLVNYSGIGAPLGINHVTTRKYVSALESLFLTMTLSPWYTNDLKRLIKTPKLHFLDSGLLAALRDLSLSRLRSERELFGSLLETFVLAELLKLASWSDDRFEFTHFRDKQQNEVDIVIENRQGRVLGIEVKASATVTKSDFAGLHRLAEGSRDRFAMGLVLHDHDKTIPFGKHMYAAPISTLWS